MDARHSTRARRLLALSLLVAAAALPAPHARAQRGVGHTLYGDVKVDESKVKGAPPPLSFDIILYFLDGRVFSRQRVSNGGRYRFNGLASGEYDLAVEVDSSEVARIRVNVGGGTPTDFRQDIEMEWKSPIVGGGEEKKPTVSVADFYQRAAANQKLYDRAEEALSAKRYADAVSLFRQLLAADAQDYQAWTEMGTAYSLQKDEAESEKSYLRAIEVRPTFALAYLALGNLRMAHKNYDGAVEILTRAVALQPPSAEANFLLGESYLQLKKGSKAVPYLEEAARLGRADAHLRLATLYNAAGLKDRAASEYEQFLAARPDYPERKKLEQYIRENKKQ
jgi:Tfp pilus assembly protein PilF